VYGRKHVRGRRLEHDHVSDRSFLPQQSDGIAHAMHGWKILLCNWSAGSFRKLQRRVLLPGRLVVGNATLVRRGFLLRGGIRVAIRVPRWKILSEPDLTSGVFKRPVLPSVIGLCCCVRGRKLLRESNFTSCVFEWSILSTVQNRCCRVCGRKLLRESDLSSRVFKRSVLPPIIGLCGSVRGRQLLRESDLASCVLERTVLPAIIGFCCSMRGR
jgi:hypothetical protein